MSLRITPEAAMAWPFESRTCKRISPCRACPCSRLLTVMSHTHTQTRPMEGPQLGERSSKACELRNRAFIGRNATLGEEGETLSLALGAKAPSISSGSGVTVVTDVGPAIILLKTENGRPKGRPSLQNISGYCAGFLCTGGLWAGVGAAVVSSAPSFMVITNGFGSYDTGVPSNCRSVSAFGISFAGIAAVI